ncbi:papain-like cysteine protease family protein [Nonomuraea sp. NPDC052265]|uniref:papain-like cysteine protease family protein n=1 Tax=Nonomuraea sp. NPDC052265 TaxID=3364374 RepID=UPI0037CAE57D
MALKAADLAALGDTPITIQSAAFPKVHLRVDGSTVTAFTDPGGGKVNGQYGPPSAWESYRVHRQPDGSVALESVAFPKVYVRMDGSAVTAPTDPGSGTVNCQYGAGLYEKFYVRDQTDGSVALESATFPKVYLRMDGSAVTSNTGSGGGTVNCQYGGAGPYEKFFLALGDQRLDFAMQHQQQTQWCWSATSVSVAAFYDPATAWTQCSLVNAERGLNTCCGPAASDANSCNQPWFVNTALTRVGHLRDTPAGALSLDQIRAELLASSPIGVRIGWAGGGGHAVVVKGRFHDAAGVEYVSVADPWAGDSDVPYDTFRNNYQGSGTWTHTYRTQR